MVCPMRRNQRSAAHPAMLRSARSSRRFDATDVRTPQMSGPSARSLAASARSWGHLVNCHDDEQAGFGVWLDDHEPGALTASGLNHESALYDAGLEPGGSIQHSADLHFGHAPLLHAQFSVAGE